jgi:DNA-binding MarR family transcriptional regulator
MNAAELHRLARILREMALLATENNGADSINAGELAVIEDIARNPGATISDVTRRTGLAQSLVSRITHAMSGAGIIRVESHATDRRKVRLDIEPAARAVMLTRAAHSIDDALTILTPELNLADRAALEEHLGEAVRLLTIGSGKPTRPQAAA